MLPFLVRYGLQQSCFLLIFLRTTIPSNTFLLPIRSPRFLSRLYAVRRSCSNTVLRFEYICNKCQSLLIICFTFGNVLLYAITKGILFWSFSFEFGVIHASLSISDNRWNSVSRNFSLKPRFINNSYNTCRFYKSSEVLVQIFFRRRALLYGKPFISDLEWAEV